MKTGGVTITTEDRDVVLECACGFTLTQPLRAPIELQCPKCRRRWRPVKAPLTA